MILLLLLGIRKEKNINFEVFHLNYHKRKESLAEQQYLKRLCDYNNVTFHIRQINNSDKYLNSNWENATRKQRFNYYKEILNERKLDLVILGHHVDDLDENILMNLFSTGSSKLNVAEFNVPCLNIKKNPLLELDNPNPSFLCTIPKLFVGSGCFS